MFVFKWLMIDSNDYLLWFANKFLRPKIKSKHK